MRKFYGFNTNIQELKDNLRAMLHGNKIYYELSGRGKGWHFEIKCDDEEYRLVDSFIERFFSNEDLMLIERG